MKKRKEKCSVFFKQIGRFDFSGGWFRGEQFKLFSLTIGEDNRDSDFITIFDIQIAKLGFQILYNTYEVEK
jgi:hypothetical protein